MDDSEEFDGLLHYFRKLCAPSDSEETELEIELQVDDVPPLDVYNQNTIYYIAGYITRSILNVSKKCCENHCLLQCIREEPPKELYTYFAFFKDYTGESLTYVNTPLYLFFVQMARVFLFNYANIFEIRHNVKSVLAKYFAKIDIDFTCEKAKITLTDLLHFV